MKLTIPFFTVLVAFLAASQAFAHKGHHHPHEEHPSDLPDPVEKESESSLRVIRENYARNVQPIFNKKCLDCHSVQTHYPWYYKFPGVKQFIDRDIDEAREHLDFTQGFPFKSHASKEEDLTAIRDSIQDGSMPPFAYRFFHPGTALTDGEKKVVFDWVEQAKAVLEKKR